jgi:hypothetical protein
VLPRCRDALCRCLGTGRLNLYWVNEITELRDSGLHKWIVQRQTCQVLLYVLSKSQCNLCTVRWRTLFRAFGTVRDWLQLLPTTLLLTAHLDLHVVQLHGVPTLQCPVKMLTATYNVIALAQILNENRARPPGKSSASAVNMHHSLPCCAISSLTKFDRLLALRLHQIPRAQLPTASRCRA